MLHARRIGDTALFGIGFLLAAAFGAADVLVLQDGDRLNGELVGVEGDTIEFREGGFFGKVRRFERGDVRAIEFSERRDSSRSAGRPSGLREKELQIPGREAWTDTGIDVRAGQEIYFAASGRIRWGKDRRNDPGGEGGTRHNPNRPIPSRPGAALIGKVGASSTDYFFIGNEQGPFRIRSSGRLFLGINDDYLLDNSDAFHVQVSY